MKRLSMWRATGTLAGANAAALALSFFTTVLVARQFGAGASMDAYTIAVSIPESLQYVLMLATLSVVFTPLFIEARTQHGEVGAWSMALSLLVLIGGIVVIAIPLLMLAMPWIVTVLAVGFAPETRALAVELSDLILPGLIYYATAGVLLGICYAYHDFTTAALNTLLLASLNLLAFFVFVVGLQGGVQGLMLGRLCALAVMQVFLLARVWRLKRGIPARVRLRNSQVWHMLTVLPPYMFGAVSGQLELVVNRSLISTLGTGSVAAWGYGQRLADIPMAVLGAALGATYLPDFAANVSAGRKTEARAEWDRAVLRVLLLLTPIAALLITLGAPLIALLFQRGAFDATATQNSAMVLAGLAIGLPLRGVAGLIVRGLPAFQSRRLPLVLSAVSSGTSIVCAFLLLQPLGLFGVALAASIGDILFALLGAVVYWRRLDTQRIGRELGEWGKIGLAAIAGGVVSVLIAQANWVEWFGNASVALAMELIVAGTLGTGLFVLLVLMLNVRSSRALWSELTQRVIPRPRSSV